MRGTPLARFMAKVSPEPMSGCWLWVGAHSRGLGYGSFKMGEVTHVAHRVAWELLRGVIPEGLEPDHLCRNRACVNPAHMELTTHRENTRRGDSPMGLNARKTHCLRGHELSGANLYIRRHNGNRECKACKYIRQGRPLPASIRSVAARPANLVARPTVGVVPAASSGGGSVEAISGGALLELAGATAVTGAGVTLGGTGAQEEEDENEAHDGSVAPASEWTQEEQAVSP